MKKVNFNVDGKFIADLAREKVTEGDWQDAINFLIDSFIGMNIEHAIDLITCKYDLTGVNDILTCDIDQKYKKNYYKEIDYLYRNYFYYEGYWIQPYYVIDNFGIYDMYNKEGCLRKVIYDENKKYIGIYGRERSYLRNHNDISIRIDNYEHPILCKKIKNCPIPHFWFKRFKDPDRLIKFVNNKDNITRYGYKQWSYDNPDHKYALQNATKNPIIINEKNYNNDSSTNQQQSINIEELFLKIKNQADAQENGWVDILDRNKKRWRVARGALEGWSLGDWIEKTNALSWDIVSPLNIKIDGDNPYHTDIVISAGIKQLDNFYDEYFDFNSALYQEAEKICADYLNVNCRVLSGKGYVSGILCELLQYELWRDAKTPVVIFPNASANMHMYAIEVWKRGGVIIVPTGGKLCHLATISREYDGKLIQYSKCNELKNKKALITVDLSNSTINITPISDIRMINNDL